MNQERAVLHFNKFKSLKNEYLRDTMKGTTIKIIKVTMNKLSESDFEVKIMVESEIDQSTMEIDSNYAHSYFKTLS